MKYGFTIPGSGPLTEPDNLSAVAKRGEELGYDLVVAPDHLVLPRAIDSVYPYAEDGIHPGTRTGSCLEQLTVLSFIAGQTSKIRIGTSVMVVPHRNPFVAAKALATSSAGSAKGREPFKGNRDQVVADVRRYRDMGVTGLLMDFAGVAGSSVGDPSQVLNLMEDFAEKVWPAV